MSGKKPKIDCQVAYAAIERKPRPKKPKKKKQKISNRERARCAARIATIWNGSRLVWEYYSGEPLQGYIQ